VLLAVPRGDVGSHLRLGKLAHDRAEVFVFLAELEHVVWPFVGTEDVSESLDVDVNVKHPDEHDKSCAMNDVSALSDQGTANASQSDSTTATDSASTGDATTWTIAQVADEFAVTHRAVRHYEELGLISPERRGTVRIYRRRDRTRLNLILRGKRLGFLLEEIRTIINLYDEPRGQASQLSYVLGQINDRRADLEQRRRDIEDALRELDDFEQRCQADLLALTSH
jgi:DNA-binding transcriptional MerR regulator